MGISFTNGWEFSDVWAQFLIITSLFLVNCGVPEAPTDGTVDMPDHTREGSSVDYRCDDGFRPAADFTSICESTARWTLQPQDHNCTFVRGKRNG